MTDVSPIAKREQDATDTEQTAVTAGQSRGTIGQSIHRADKPADITRRRPIWPVLVAAAIILPVAGAGGWLGLRLLSQWRNQQYADQCHEYMKMQAWKKLEDVSEKWCQREPDKAEPWMYAAEAAQQQEQYARAADLLNRVPDDDPRAVGALLVRTGLLFDTTLNDPLEAVATCERILRIDPTCRDARQHLIFFCAVTFQRQEMEYHIYEAIRLGVDTPEDYVYLIGKDFLIFANGAEINGKWLEKYPDYEPFIIAHTLHLIGTGKPEEIGSTSIPEYSTLPAQSPSALGSEGIGTDPNSGNGQGENHPPFDRTNLKYMQRISEYEKAMGEYMVRFPRNTELLVFFLKKASLDGDQERVAELLEQAPPEAKEDSRFWRYLGWLQSERGDLEEAEKTLHKAIALHPYDFLTRHMLAEVMRRLGRPEEDIEFVQGLSTEGTELRRILMQETPDPSVVAPGVLNRMAFYARFCGDEQVAEALDRRVAALQEQLPK